MKNERVAIVGLGTQGNKRLANLGNDVAILVDPCNPIADFKTLQEVPIQQYSAAIVCSPDPTKDDLITYLVENSKHVLCEKPLTLQNHKRFKALELLAKSKKTLIYTAYNHRFEPGIKKIKELLECNVLGTLYSINLIYGNGTARLVAESTWKDEEPGVVGDLGSHLLDILLFLLPEHRFTFSPGFKDRNENKAIDHAFLISTSDQPRVTLEVSLCKWKNAFECEIVGEKGSLHLSGLGKWGTVLLTHRIRKYPSGIPDESKYIFPKGDNSWTDEYIFFKELIYTGRMTNLSHDLYIYEQLYSLQLGFKE